MRSNVAAAVVFLLVTAAHAADAPPTRYMDLINRSHDSITSVEIALAGSAAFRIEPLRGRLRGGGGSATIAVSGEDCVYDLRFTFRDGRRAGAQRSIFAAAADCASSRAAARRFPPSLAARSDDDHVAAAPALQTNAPSCIVPAIRGATSDDSCNRGTCRFSICSTSRQDWHDV